MAENTTTSPAPRKKRSWLRILGWGVGIVVVLLVVLYFVATSSAFFKGVVLPKVSKAVGADVTVSDASISPFKQVILHNLKVQTAGAEPLVTAPEVRLRYSLMDIIGGNLHVEEATLSSLTVSLVTNPDGTSNLDPILKAQQQQAKEQPKEQKPAQPGKPSKPMQVELKKLAITDGTVRSLKLDQGGTRDVAEISHLNITLENVKNGQTAKLGLGADINVQNNPPAPSASGLLQAKLNGAFTFALTSDLKPGSIQGNTRLEVARAEGAMAQLAALNTTLDCNITPTDIKEVALRFQKGDTQLGQIRASGPFNMEKTEGHLTVEVLNIDKDLLNLAGASSGIDFGPTKINSTNEIQLANAGAVITAAGQFNLNQLQLTRTNQTTPPLDLRANYNLTVDRAASNALLRTFTLVGTQKGHQVINGELTSPMTFSWGNTGSAVGDSALNLAVTHLDLADWKPFLGQVAPAGDVNMNLKLLSQEAGKQLRFDLNSEIANLTAGSGSNQITQINVKLLMRGQAAELKQFKFPEYRLEVARQNQPMITFSGSGTYDQPSQSADMQLNGQVLLARLLQALPRPDMNFSAGTIDLKTRLVQQQTNQNITGNFMLADLTGNMGSNVFRSFSTTADFDIGMTPQLVEIRKIVGKLTEGSNPGGSFNVSGTYDLTKTNGQFAAKLADFNQNGLRPFLQAALADKELVSVALNANAKAQYAAQGASALTADLQVTNLVVRDPKGQFPATPLEASMKMDASLDKNVADIRQFQLALTPTARATNQVQLTGRVDMSQTNAITGNLKLAADSLDVTSYYDLFTGQAQPAGTKPEAAPKPTPTPAPSPAPPGPEKEPEAMQLPFRNFTAEANIGRFYLREVDIAGLQTVVKIDGGHVSINPCKLTLNGAPVNANIDANLGVPGYKYDVAFSAQAIPLAPLVDSFQPERKGQLGGTFTAQTKISGAGITGASLQKSLAGSFDAGSTNLNLSVVNIKNPLLKVLVNVVSTIPELVRNPTAGLTSLVQGFAGSAGTSGGLANDLQKSPIDTITARGVIGSGKMELQDAVVRSPAFEASAKGTVTLAEVLTNSTIQIPVTVALSRPVAQRINMVPPNTPTNAAYVPLPEFLTLTGTVGNPGKKVNTMALAKVAAQSLGGGFGGKSGNVLQGVTGLLGGGASAGTNTPGTTNQPGGGGLGGLLQGLTRGSATNAPATNQAPVNNLLRGLLKK